mgnify:CR=1 FL=1
MANKKRDDEKLHWLLAGGLFTALLIGLDIWYSSYSIMHWLFGGGLILGHLILSVLWIGVMIKFNDYGFDYLRKFTVWVSIILALVVGIHHATAREDKQVLIDSKENKAKDSIEKAKVDTSQIRTIYDLDSTK